MRWANEENHVIHVHRDPKGYVPRGEGGQLLQQRLGICLIEQTIENLHY
jgi:hypothetical protein